MKTITDEQLTVMFNNFAKISQWLSKGKEAKYPLPPLLETLFNEIETLKNELAELKNQTQISPSSPTQTTVSETETETEAQTEPLPSSSDFTMEEVENGEINEEAFAELDKQLNNLLTE